MNNSQKKRLIGAITVLLLISLGIALILFALKQNINLFYTPTQLQSLSNHSTKTIRLGGYVKMHSVEYDVNNQSIHFIITDKINDTQVSFQGILPNLFKEGQTVVVTGKLNNAHQLIATQVLAKHDEKYMPAALRKELQKGSSHATGNR